METEMKNNSSSGSKKGLGFGLVLMFVGGLFLADNFNLISFPVTRVVFSWQMLLIVIGLINLFKQKIISGVILIFVGGFFIIPKVFPAIDDQFIHIYWPLLLIGAGIVILLQRIIKPEGCCNALESKFQGRENRHKSYQKWEKNHLGFSKNSVFANVEHIVLDPEFKGGELNAVFGGLSLDLRRTNLAVGETLLDVNAVFGGVTIFVPTDWLIETHLDAVFGGFQDNRMPKEPLDGSRKLIITGSCVFGGGEIRN